MQVRVEVTGDRELAARLDAIDERLRLPMTPLLEVLGQEAASHYQDGISKRLLDLPEHHWLTTLIRRKYGHASKAPLVRGGDLLHSIAPLAYGDDFVEVGSQLPYAKVVHDGGTMEGPEPGRDERGRFDGTKGPGTVTREVQAFPFLVARPELLSDIDEMVTDYFFGEEGAAA